jgi:hypothetical protein
MYIDILHHLRDAVRRKCPEKWRTNRRFLLHESTPVGFGQGFINKEWCDNIGASPVISCLSPADFYPFAQLKSVLMGWRFCDATVLIKTAREELKRLS